MEDNMRPEELIIEMKFGSHLYGTSTPESDTDFKAVYIPSGRSIALQRVKDVVVSNTKVNEENKNTSEDVDRETYALHKFLHLLAQGQTVALDMLFANDEVITYRGNNFHIWQEIYSNREKLISKQCKSFIGYCRQQANKYGIKGSRMNEAEKAAMLFNTFVNANAGNKKLYEIRDELEQLVKDGDHTEIVKITNPSGIELEHFSCCNRKSPFTITIKEAARIYEHLFNEYGKRARAAKENEGLDWKALSHAVRVGTQALELLRHGTITMPRPDRQELLQIKTGQLQYEAVSDKIVALLEEVESTAAMSHLPELPNYQWIDNFVAECYSKQVG
jgi:predicted nucleotidyltransferase